MVGLYNRQASYRPVKRGRQVWFGRKGQENDTKTALNAAPHCDLNLSYTYIITVQMCPQYSLHP